MKEQKEEYLLVSKYTAYADGKIPHAMPWLTSWKSCKKLKKDTISGAIKTDSKRLLKEICPNLVHCAAADAIHILLRLRVRIGGSSKSTIMEFLLTWWLLKRKNMLGPIVTWKWTTMHFKMSHQSLDDSAEKKCSTWGHISKANTTMTVFYLKQTFVKIQHKHYVNLTI